MVWAGLLKVELNVTEGRMHEGSFEGCNRDAEVRHVTKIG